MSGVLSVEEIYNGLTPCYILIHGDIYEKALGVEHIFMQIIYFFLGWSIQNIFDVDQVIYGDRYPFYKRPTHGVDSQQIFWWHYIWIIIDLWCQWCHIINVDAKLSMILLWYFHYKWECWLKWDFNRKKIIGGCTIMKGRCSYIGLNYLQ